MFIILVSTSKLRYYYISKFFDIFITPFILGCKNIETIKLEIMSNKINGTDGLIIKHNHG